MNTNTNTDSLLLSQSDVQKILKERGGNRDLKVDPWEGFDNVSKEKILNDKKNINNMMNSMNGLPPDVSQSAVSNFFKNRGGNKGESLHSKPTPTPTQKSTSNSSNKIKEKFTNQKAEPDSEFYKGDKILQGNFFDGWNDTYFFNTSLFRENIKFWENPFKKV
jgi:hypothetical protein